MISGVQKLYSGLNDPNTANSFSNSGIAVETWSSFQVLLASHFLNYSNWVSR